MIIVPIVVGAGIVIAIVLSIYFTVPKNHKVTNAIYEDKTQILWVKWSNGLDLHFKGSSTVWRTYPMMDRCSTSMESELYDIWSYIKEHGNPYPTAHLNKKPTPPKPHQP